MQQMQPQPPLSAQSSAVAKMTSPPYFTNAPMSNIPPSLSTSYNVSQQELAAFDAHMRREADKRQDKLANIDVLMGIPYYTELTNIVSVLVTLKEVFEQRRQRACIMVIGEYSRSDQVQLIKPWQLDETEARAEMNTFQALDDSSHHASSRTVTTSYSSIVTFWKPQTEYAGKPFTVRALQVIANCANGGNGTHLIIMDADIQFNHWELSAMSLMRALLDPLIRMPEQLRSPSPTSSSPTQSSPASAARETSTIGSDGSDLPRPPAASFVLLNAPRSFISDDALIHLFSYCMTYAYTSQHIHQSHGGEFSIHRRLNRSLLVDDTIVYRRSYCVEAQLVVRALLEEQQQTRTNTYGGYVLEMLMKGKWHAKISLNKLLAIDASSGDARVDLVTERIFQDALLFSSIKLHTSKGQVHHRNGGLTRTLHPDPNHQKLNVLCPLATKKEMMHAIKIYYIILLAAQSDGSLPVNSRIVQTLIPDLYDKIAQIPDDQGWYRVQTTNNKSTATNQGNGTNNTNSNNNDTNTTTINNSSNIHATITTNNVVTSETTTSTTSTETSINPHDILVFGANEWALYTMELVLLYQKANTPKTRSAVITGNRVVWLLGALAFLNQHSAGNWGAMHQTMHTVYAPAFRRQYLTDVVGMDLTQANHIVNAERTVIDD